MIELSGNVEELLRHEPLLAVRYVAVVIVLRDVRDADLDTFFEHWGDDQALRMAAFTPADARERVAFDARWERQRKDPANLLKTIEVDGEAVGSIGSWDNERQREVTYWIGRAHWGKGSLPAPCGRSLTSRRRGRSMPPRPPTTLARSAFLRSAGSESSAKGVRSQTRVGRRSMR
jgi:hypothetical protein